MIALARLPTVGAGPKESPGVCLKECRALWEWVPRKALRRRVWVLENLQLSRAQSTRGGGGTAEKVRGPCSQKGFQV